jgi:HD-GYP domain-containing protein (c-di-GMP phosphodiesterase class II)
MKINFFPHQDSLAGLSKPKPAQEKLSIIHAALQETYPFVDRISVALYDEKTDMLRSFIFSEEGWDKIAYYEAPMSKMPSLKAIVAEGRPRVVNDLSVFDSGESEHSKVFKVRQYQSSYTSPIIFNDSLWGFVFFNSPNKVSFYEEILDTLDVYSHLISHVVFRELNAIRVILAFFDLLIGIVHDIDPETGDHIERVSRFSRLIALELARKGKYDLTDEAIEYIHEFSGLHDIGKIVIPDDILLKPGKLNQEEWKTMKTHADQGSEITDRVMKAVKFLSFEYDEYANNIAKYHHENVDGSGYPMGLGGKEIPLEARIVAVADVFDALSSERPYKKAWTNEESFAELLRIADLKLDRDCVDALHACQKEVEAIQKQFPH